MSQPVIVEIPHKLGAAPAKARLESGVQKLTSFVPGATVTDRRWEGDQLIFTVHAMGQRVAALVDVADEHIRIELDLPPVLSLLANKAKAFLAENGRKLLQ